MKLSLWDPPNASQIVCVSGSVPFLDLSIQELEDKKSGANKLSPSKTPNSGSSAKAVA